MSCTWQDLMHWAYYLTLPTLYAAACVALVADAHYHDRAMRDYPPPPRRPDIVLHHRVHRIFIEHKIEP